jgi:UDP-N-acetylglucosamine--N-acetylmuramyl-(pentapeptide) pyrophosphoryl-undecaprenol N-acetylglucosamine transferase
MAKGVIILCAGGTGGHLFPAEALAHELAARGWVIHLATDERANRYSADFPASDVHMISSATISLGNPISMVRAVIRLVAGYWQSRKLFKLLRPALVIGFGGYPTLPPVLAAQFGGIATIIHDANAVMGRANRLLAHRANLVAMGFRGERQRDGVTVTGNPVRPAILQAAKTSYRDRDKDAQFNLLVFGGSQGAQFFGEILPKAVELLDDNHIRKLKIIHQVREETLYVTQAYYRSRGIDFQVASFFQDMAAHIANAHLVICRAGASTVSELAVIGRPAILVPYPYALDHDQAMNAIAIAENGGADIVQQVDLTAERLAEILISAMDNPERLAQMAKNAKKAATINAAARLADYAEHIAAGISIENLTTNTN